MSMAAYRLLTLSVVCAVTLWSTVRCGEVKVASCDENKPEELEAIKAVRVSECTETPCKMKKGNNYTVEIDMLPKAASKTLQVAVAGLFGTVAVPWIGFQKDACAHGHVSCPFPAGTPFTVKYDIAILPIFPTISLFSTWNITDDNSGIACFKIEQSLVA